MKQTEFLSELASFLQQSLKQEDLNDILNDYKLHFQNGLLEGKSEMEIAADLGTPEDIARDILGEEQRFTEEPNYYTPRIEKPKRSKTAKVLFIILFVFLDITIIIPVSITFCRIVVRWTVLAFTWQSYTVKGGHKYE